MLLVTHCCQEVGYQVLYQRQLLAGLQGQLYEECIAILKEVMSTMEIQMQCLS